VEQGSPLPDHRVETNAAHGLRTEVTRDGAGGSLLEGDAGDLGEEVDAIRRQPITSFPVRAAACTHAAMLVWRLGAAWKDEEKLAETWRAAEPFPHLVIDDFVPDEALPELLAIVDEEPVDRYAGDIFSFEATAPEPKTEGLRALRDAFASTLAPTLSRIAAKPLRRVDMRAYAYRAGHYLLPHSDHQQGVGRALAYAYYLPSPEPPEGGELELFRCVMESGEIVATESERLVEPRPNRLIVFDVSDVSLHQVREVLGGLRPSLAGWFYP
jgi:hypothetical protein